MAEYIGFKAEFKRHILTKDESFSVDCLSVNFLNLGQDDTEIMCSLDDESFSYKLKKGDSITFPEGGNNNPLLKIQQPFRVKFNGNVSPKCFVTITNAIPTVLTY